MLAYFKMKPCFPNVFSKCYYMSPLSKRQESRLMVN